MTNLQLLNEIEKHLTLARMQRSHLAALIYTLTASNPDACELLLAQIQRITEIDNTVAKHIEALYDALGKGRFYTGAETEDN